MSDPLIHVKLCFFEESVKKPNDFLVAFQTTAPLVPFLVNSLEIPVRRFAEKFILPDVLSKIKPKYILSLLDLKDENMQKRAFPLIIISMYWKSIKKFIEKGKNLHPMQTNFSKEPINILLCPLSTSLNLINLAETPDSCEKWFHHLGWLQPSRIFFSGWCKERIPKVNIWCCQRT